MRRVVTVGLLALVCFAMFDAPSTYVVACTGARIVALVVGLVAFPVLPLGWHTFAEWRRRRGGAAKSSLTGRDRLLLRVLAVAFLALGGTWFVARGETLGALRHHGLWFTDWSEPDPVADSGVLARVPAGAELVIWLRPGHTQELLPVALSGDAEIVVAMSGSETFIAIAASEPVLDQFTPLVAADHDGRLAAVDAPAGVRAYATPGWRGAPIGLPPGLARLLHIAPQDATAMIAAQPVRLNGAHGITAGIGWARVRDHAVDYGGDVDTVDLATATALVAFVHALDDSSLEHGDCSYRAFRGLTDPSLIQTGTHVQGFATGTLDAASDVPRCMAHR
jgi:hypothetical protein